MKITRRQLRQLINEEIHLVVEQVTTLAAVENLAAIAKRRPEGDEAQKLIKLLKGMKEKDLNKYKKMLGSVLVKQGYIAAMKAAKAKKTKDENK
jgi:hypothetical protein